MNWQDVFAKRVVNIKSSTIREILKLTQESEIISFAGGLPAPGLFPGERIKEATIKVLENRPEQALQYSLTEGYPALREWIGQRIAQNPDYIQIVSGSQQGLDIIAKLLLNKGDKVVVSSPTYMGALRAFDVYGVDYSSVETDENGMLPDALEKALKRGAKLIYVIPNFDNPAGTTMSLERRQKLVELSRKYGVAIVEDNPYGELRFRNKDLPNLLDLAPEMVIYCSTFSKIMVPGFRLAWLVVRPEMMKHIVNIKQASDLHTSTFTQMITYEVTKAGFMDEQIARVRSYYKQQNEAMLSRMNDSFPDEISWTNPDGGMFLWVILPKAMNAAELLNKAVAKKVAYVPGFAFYANNPKQNTLRLSYSVASLEQIEMGIKSLAEVFKEHMDKA